MPVRRSALTLVVGWLGASALLVILGLSVHDGLLLSGVVLIQGLTGAFVWSWVRRADRLPALELLGMGLAIGTTLALLSGVLLNAILPWSGWWFAPSLVALVIGILNRRRGLVLLDVASGGWVAWFLGILAGLVGLWLNLRRYPMTWPGTWDLYHRDMVFFEALGTGVARFGAGDSIFMTGAPIRYHWFAYAWAGQLGDAVDAAPFAALTRVLPLVALVGTLALCVSWARSLSSVRWVPSLAALLLAAGGYVGAVNGTILNFDSPSQAMSTLWLLAFVIALLRALTHPSRLGWLVIGVLAIAMTGGKVSTAITALGGLGILALVSIARRTEWRWRALGALGLGALLTAGTFVLVLAGNASSGDLQVLSLDSRAAFIQGLNSSLGPRGVIIGTFVLVAAIAARWIGVTWLLADPSWHWRPDVVLAAGMGLVGVLAIVVFSQGVNETWFALAASAPLSVLSTVGLGVAWTQLRDPRGIAFAIIVGLLVTPIIAIPWAHGWPGNYTIRFWAPVTAYLIALVAGVIAPLSSKSPRVRAGIAVALTVLVVASATARALPILGAGWIAVVGQPSANDKVEPAIGDTIAQPPAAPLPATEGVAPAATPAAVISAPRERTGWSDDERSAASWLVEHSSRTSVIVTNEVVSFMVPALTGLRTYMSGASYQDLYGSKETVGAIPDRIETSMQFTSAPDQVTASDFAKFRDAGVNWVWIAKDLPHAADWSGFGEVAFENDAVLLVTLPSTAR